MAKSIRAAANNRANQMIPNNTAYQSSRMGSGHSQPALDNRSNQLNPNHEASKPPATPPDGATPVKGSDGSGK